MLDKGRYGTGQTPPKTRKGGNGTASELKARANQVAKQHEGPEADAETQIARSRGEAEEIIGQLSRKGSEGVVSAPKMSILTVPLVNRPGSPLVIHAFSEKARKAMREAQAEGGAKNKRRQKEPKDFDAAYMGARHISTEGWDGISAAAFRKAMISACRLVGFKMTIGKLSVFIEADGVSAADGTPLVRIYGEPVAFEAPVRNASGVSDIRVRPRWDRWTAKLRVRYDSEQFHDTDVLNLLVRAGGQCGVGEGRPDSSNSFGQGWGMFEIDRKGQVRLEEIEMPQFSFTRIKMPAAKR